MRRSLCVVALLCSTALTPTRADAGFVAAFIAGISGAGFAGAVGGLASSAYLVGSSIGAFASTALGGFVVNSALSYGLSAIAQSLVPKAPTAKNPSSALVNFAQPVALMEWVFGRVRKGGPYGFTSFRKDRRHYAILLAAHQIDGVEQHYVDNVPVLVGSDDLVQTEPYAPYIRIKAYPGSLTQQADSVIMAAVPEWTSSHDMRGLAYVAAFARRVSAGKFNDVYGDSAETGPVITPVIRGALVFDPRTGQTAYSNNAALVWAWVTENRLGVGTVDWDDVAIEATAADDLVQNKQGALQRKWTLNGSFSDDQTYESLIAQIILATDGHLYERPDGKIGFKVGRYIEPTITLTDDDFFMFEISENSWGQDAKTEFAARYVEPDNDWNESASGVIVADAAARSVRDTVSIFFCDSHNQTSRALYRLSKASRPQYRVTGQIGPIALDLLAERFVRLDIAGREFVAEISKITPADDDSTFEIVLSSTVKSDWDFVAATQEPERPTLDRLEGDNVVPTIQSISGAAQDGPAISWQWPAQDESFDQEIRIRAVGDVEWGPITLISTETTSFLFNGLTDGQAYTVQIRNVTAAKRVGDWLESGSVTAIRNSVPPEPITDFFVSSGVGGVVDIQWNTPNDPNHAWTEIYRAAGSGASFSSAVSEYVVYGPANVLQSTLTSGVDAGVYVYWGQNANSSGTVGPLIGPQEITVT